MNLLLFVTLGSSIVPCSAVVRDLGILLDSELSMKHHIRSPAPVTIISEGYIKSVTTLVMKP